jgi:hypothetical protein
VAEQLRLEDLGRDRGAVDRQETVLVARRVLVQRVGDQFLARPGLADDEHVRARRRDQLHLAKQLLHRLGTALELGELGVQSLLQLVDPLAVLVLLEQLGHARAQLLDVDRLGQVVVRAALHRVDGRLHRAVSGDHQHADPRIDAFHLVQDTEAVRTGQHQIGEDQTDVAVLSHVLQRGFRLGEGHDTVAGA